MWNILIAYRNTIIDWLKLIVNTIEMIFNWSYTAQSNSNIASQYDLLSIKQLLAISYTSVNHFIDTGAKLYTSQGLPNVNAQYNRIELKVSNRTIGRE